MPDGDHRTTLRQPGFGVGRAPLTERRVSNRCAHADYQLQRADGRVLVQEGRFLICGVHGASYGLDDGACAGGPCNGRGLARVAVEVRDGVIFTA
jgi:nitrite reductase/ring-hydroxylating ferredoxin subunit